MADVPRAEIRPPLKSGDLPSFLPQLDGLRGIAVLLVLWVHFPFVTGSKASLLFWQAGEAARGGFIGVDLFFVLSGFLITRNLLTEQSRTGQISYGRFYLRRFLRICPVYYLTLLAVGLLTDIPANQLWFGAVYLLNYLFMFSDDISPIPHTWSLCVEEQFYLFWPFLVAVLPMRAGRFVTGLIVPGIAIAICLAIAVLITAPPPDAIIYRALPTRMISLSLGAFLAYSERVRQFPSLRQCLAALAAGLGILAVAGYARAAGFILNPGIYWTFILLGFGALGTGATGALTGSAVSAPGLMQFFQLAPLRYVGRISYGLYLYHYPVLAYLKISPATVEHTGTTAGLWLLSIVLTVVIAVLSFHLIERPLLSLQGRKHSTPEPDLQLLSISPGTRGSRL